MIRERYLGLDLGVKTCGVAISDPSNVIILPRKNIRFKRECYDECAREVETIIKDNNITDVVIGMPINMDGTLGFATKRVENFINNYLNNMSVKIHTVDERLTSVQAEKMLHDIDIHGKDFKDKLDMEAASLILESYLRSQSGK